MQQNQDNLTDENPYSPPKSEDFRQPENYFRHTKKQYIIRVIFATLFLIMLMALIAIDLYAFIFGVNKINILGWFNTFKTYIHSMGIQSLIYFIVTEKYVLNFKKKYFYSILGALFLSVTNFLVVSLTVLGFKQYSLSYHLGSILGTMIFTIPSMLCTTFVLNIHTAYCKNKSI